MAFKQLLLTGFEPYGGRGTNPAHEVMKVLDGHSIRGVKIVGRGLPVSLNDIGKRLDALLDEVKPCAVVSLGLWPGEAIIRLERVGLNVADFEIADNDGYLARGAPVKSNGRPAHFSTLPLREIESTLLADGIPARISSTAGTYLCNACLFTLLDRLQSVTPVIPAGFIHVPYVPEQVAQLLLQSREAAALELHQRADMASMELSRIVRAIEIAIETTLIQAGF